MEVLINGDLYIKIKPSVFNPSIDEIDSINEELYKIAFEEAANWAAQLTEKCKEILNSIIEVFEQKGELDYSYLENFFILLTDGKDITMKSYDELLKKEILITFDFNGEEMKEYKRLIDFLSEAEFVGREIKIYGDFPGTTNPTLLYKTDYAMCILNPRKGYISMLDIRGFGAKLGDKDEAAEKYGDKQLLYKTIVKQLVELSKKCSSNHEHGKNKF